MARCSASLISGRVQVKTTVRQLFITARVTLMNRKHYSWQSTEKFNPHILPGGIKNVLVTVENISVVSPQRSPELPYNEHFHSWVSGSRDSTISMNANVDCISIYKAKKGGKNWVVKLNVIGTLWSTIAL